MPVTGRVASLRDSSGHSNLILYVPARSGEPDKLTLFFPGDISDFPFSRGNDPLIAGESFVHEYGYSIDALTWRVASRLDDRTALIVFKPNMMMGYYSIYSNFLLCDSTGNPRWADMALMPALVCPSQTLTEFLSYFAREVDASVPMDRISLVGFSKGCILLSSLLRDQDSTLLSKIHSMVYVDPAAQTRGSLFPFNDNDYASFPSIALDVWVSPYVYNNPQRDWLPDEIDDFVAKSGATLRPVLADRELSLDNHFACIDIALA